jgi:hypothetical protein
MLFLRSRLVTAQLEIFKGVLNFYDCVTDKQQFVDEEEEDWVPVSDMGAQDELRRAHDLVDSDSDSDSNSDSTNDDESPKPPPQASNDNEIFSAPLIPSTTSPRERPFIKPLQFTPPPPRSVVPALVLSVSPRTEFTELSAASINMLVSEQVGSMPSPRRNFLASLLAGPDNHDNELEQVLKDGPCAGVSGVPTQAGSHIDDAGYADEQDQTMLVRRWVCDVVFCFHIIFLTRFQTREKNNRATLHGMAH